MSSGVGQRSAFQHSLKFKVLCAHVPEANLQPTAQHPRTTPEWIVGELARQRHTGKERLPPRARCGLSFQIHNHVMSSGAGEWSAFQHSPYCVHTSRRLTCNPQPNTLGLRRNGSSGSWHDNGTQGRSVSLPEPGAAYPFKSTTTSCPRVPVSGPHSNIPPSWRHPAMCLPWRSRVPSKARIDDSISPGSPWASAHHHTTTRRVDAP
ncbi:hypothetical protein KC19_N025200 [Ceratodon purpureus]|nr:hypothetical protein KC19_N025200 [Ceratodon purpureus]